MDEIKDNELTELTEEEKMRIMEAQMMAEEEKFMRRGRLIDILITATLAVFILPFLITMICLIVPDKADENTEYTAQVEKLAELTGMKYYYFAPAIHLPQGPYGNGLLSKYPILKTEIIPIPDPAVRGYDGYYETRCVLKAEIEGGVTVLVSHFGLNPDEQELAVHTALSNITEHKCILMGDFNMKPNDPILRPIMAAMTDAASVMEEQKMSFPSDAPFEKIDYIFLSWDAKVLAADIPAIVASDHRPHTAVVEF